MEAIHRPKREAEYYRFTSSFVANRILLNGLARRNDQVPILRVGL